jgi:hypothetical protein
VNTVTLKITWIELFDVEDPSAYRKRWEDWKRLALDAGEKDQVEFWTDADACRGCKHLDGDWCLRTGLPCSVNPYLTIKKRMGPGMACMGMGYDDGINQGELFSEF